MKTFSEDAAGILRGFRFARSGATICMAMAAAGCGTPQLAAPGSGGPDSGTDGGPTNVLDATTADARADAGDSGTYTEQTLTLELALNTTVVPSDAGSQGVNDASVSNASVDAGGSDASVSDASADAGAADATPADDAGEMEVDGSPASDPPGEGGVQTVTTLTITARDGVTPVVTDLWLYTFDSQGNQTPLTGFTSSQPRKSPRLMLPATIKGDPSGLSPADNGDENGTMTCSCGSRGTLDQGAFVSAVTGTVVVTLPATPATPILVVAGVEDERYAGAAVINPDGSPGTVPSGVGVPETHTRVSFTNDVAPILKSACIACHTGQGPMSDAGDGVGKGYSANFYPVTGTADDLVNGNFALNEQTLDCETEHPDGGLPLAQCIQAITQAQFLVEPGAPAASDLLQRARPDENAGTSTLGLLWYGSKGGTERYSTTYGDRRMPSTTQATNPDSGTWDNLPCYFDSNPAQYQIIWDWVAQGAISN